MHLLLFTKNSYFRVSKRLQYESHVNLPKFYSDVPKCVKKIHLNLFRYWEDFFFFLKEESFS